MLASRPTTVLSQYNAQPGEKMNVAVACYGDGAANQGQIWEAANMASLWKLVSLRRIVSYRSLAFCELLFEHLPLSYFTAPRLPPSRLLTQTFSTLPTFPSPCFQPMIFCIENNQYGMGTSIDRHSSIQDYYKMGNAIPGIRIDGMNVLAVREGVRYAKEYCGNGHGPMYMEMMTYRYHGHSMSDPGTTYRNREEIAFTRSTRDPIAFVKTSLIEAGFADDAELKEMEKRIRKLVQQEVLEAKQSARPQPPMDLISHIFAKDLTVNGESDYPPHIRFPDYSKSFWADGKQD